MLFVLARVLWNPIDESTFLLGSFIKLHMFFNFLSFQCKRIENSPWQPWPLMFWDLEVYTMINSWNFLLPNFCLGSFLTWICPDFQEEQREKVLQEAEQAVRRCPPWNLQFATENGWLEDYFPFGMAYFEGKTVSFRECNCVECVVWETSLCVVCRCACKLSQSAQNGNWNIYLY